MVILSFILYCVYVFYIVLFLFQLNHHLASLECTGVRLGWCAPSKIIDLFAKWSTRFFLFQKRSLFMRNQGLDVLNFNFVVMQNIVSSENNHCKHWTPGLWVGKCFWYIFLWITFCFIFLSFSLFSSYYYY